MLIVVIAGLGVAFSVLLERELRADVDHRILQTARNVRSDVQVFIDPDTGATSGTISTPPDFYSFPSLLIQILDSSGNIQLASENLNSPIEPQVTDDAPVTEDDLFVDVDTGVRRLPAAESEPGSAAPVFTTGELDGVQVRTVHLPLVLRNSGETVGAVNVGEPLIQLNQTLSHVRRLLSIGALLGVAASAFLGWVLAGRALRPVDRIRLAAANIAEESRVGAALSTRLEVGQSEDELTRLARTFNRMLDRLQVTFEGQRRFIADASHELRTPLTAIRGNVDVLARQLDHDRMGSSDLSETLDDLRRESARMSRLVEDLLLLARTDSVPADAVRITSVRIDDVGAEAIRVAGGLANGQRLVLSAPGPVKAIADRDRSLQVALILVENAIRHTPPGGEIELAVWGDRTTATMAVRDTGQGIAPEHLPHIFDRFYRADASRQRGSGGTGLGLAIARAIVQNQRGTIEVRSELGLGSTFTVTLPAVTQSSSGPDRSPQSVVPNTPVLQSRSE